MGKLIWNYCVICWIGEAIYYGFQHFIGSDKQKAQEYLYCIVAAQDLGQNQSAEIIANKLGRFLAKNKVEITQYEFSEMRSNAKNYVQYKKGSIAVFNSSDCQKLHGQPEITIRNIVGQ